VSDYLESDGVSRQVEVRSGHDGSKKAEAEEDMEGDSSSTELLRRCFTLLCAGSHNLRPAPHPSKAQPCTVVIGGREKKLGIDLLPIKNAEFVFFMPALTKRAGASVTKNSYEDPMLEGIEDRTIYSGSKESFVSCQFSC
jgi:hypothetical protein